MKKVLVAATIVAISVFTGCNNNAGDPKAVLGQFFDALSKKDMVTARKLSTADSKTMLDMMEMGTKTTDVSETDKFKTANMQFGEAKIEGDKATIAVKEKTSGESMNYTLKKEGGAWKVAFDKTSMMSMGIDKMNEKGIDMTDSLKSAMDQLKNMDMDSLKNQMKEGSKVLDSAAKMLEGLKN